MGCVICLVTLAALRGRNPFSFMDLHDVQKLENFFELRVSAYQVGVTDKVTLDAFF
jgi:ribonucleoside-diphosphate reductase beta chain